MAALPPLDQRPETEAASPLGYLMSGLLVTAVGAGVIAFARAHDQTLADLVGIVGWVVAVLGGVLTLIGVVAQAIMVALDHRGRR